MNHAKRADAVIQKNKMLLDEVDELRRQLEEMTRKTQYKKEEIDQLILDLRNIKRRWLVAIEDLKEKRTEYDNLIFALQEMKGVMVDMNFTIPWYKKLKMKAVDFFGKK